MENKWRWNGVTWAHNLLIWRQTRYELGGGGLWDVNLAWDVYSNGSFNLEKYSSFIFSICLIHKILISVFIPDWLLTSVLNLFFLLGYLKIPTMWYFSYILHIQGFWSEYLFPDCQTDVTPQKGKQVSSSLMPWFIRYFWTLLPRRTFIWIKFI